MTRITITVVSRLGIVRVKVMSAVRNAFAWRNSKMKVVGGAGARARTRRAILCVSRSDGPQPHLINIQFHKKMHIHEIVVYTDFKLDESYTPTRVSVRGGTNFNDLQEIEVVDMTEPTGWIVIPLKESQS